MARNQKNRLTGERPLRWGDLTRGERAGASRLLQDRQRNLKGAIQARVDTATRSNRTEPKPSDVNALASGRIRTAARLATLPNMARAVMGRTERAASETRLQREGEGLAGTGFYFDARRPLAALNSNQHSVDELAGASSRLSPKTDPKSEQATLAALATAHQEGYVHFHPAVVDAVNTHYAKAAAAENTSPKYSVPESLHGKEVSFAKVPHQVVNALRKRENHAVARTYSSGVDWDGMSKVGIDGNVSRSHRMLQGDPNLSFSVSQHPKQVGYARSIAEATPDVENEYRLRSAQLARTIRGEEAPGQMALDVTGQLDSNEGMLSNKAPIAADTWTRRATSGQDLDVAGPVAETFATAKGNIARGDKSVTAVGIEHAQQQEAVERASRGLQEKYQTPFTVPSRLVQETGGWAQPRRESGGDPEYNAEARNLSGGQFKPKQTRLF